MLISIGANQMNDYENRASYTHIFSFNLFLIIFKKKITSKKVSK